MSNAQLHVIAGCDQMSQLIKQRKNWKFSESWIFNSNASQKSPFSRRNNKNIAAIMRTIQNQSSRLNQTAYEGEQFAIVIQANRKYSLRTTHRSCNAHSYHIPAPKWYFTAPNCPNGPLDTIYSIFCIAKHDSTTQNSCPGQRTSRQLTLTDRVTCPFRRHFRKNSHMKVADL